MLTRRILIVSLIVFFTFPLFAGEKYWVFFRDKKNVSFNPTEYFDSRTLERRARLGIPTADFSDLPLNSEYVSGIEAITEVSVKSRWLNAVSVSVSDKQLAAIRKLDYVRGVEKIMMVAKHAGVHYEYDDSTKLEHIRQQTGVMGGELFAEHNIDGKGVRIAVFDGGFPGVDSLEMFSHLFENDQIIATFNFVDGEEFVYDYNNHGTRVLGCLAGMKNGIKYGLATGAEYLLARTEISREVFAEEEYWAAAMEWADKHGADIISSSLGYTYHRYFPKQMDGKTVFVSRIANKAASKGILVVNAAGNDGNSDWEVISAPADADSVLSVGGISSNSKTHSNFSSYGPTADGRLKPNVVAFGDVITAGNGKDVKTYGTSFSTPLVSGFAACVMQMNPEWDNMKVFKEIERSGNLYPYYDYAHGYGVPQASYFIGSGQEASPVFTVKEKVNVFDIEIMKNTGAVNKIDPVFGRDLLYLYIHFADEKTGKIRRYKLIKMEESDRYTVRKEEIKKGEVLRVHYGGYTKTIKL